MDGRIEGSLALRGSSRSLVGPAAYVTGRVTGWTGPPAGNGSIPLAEGMYCKNLTAAAPNPDGRLTVGWLRVGARWRAVAG